jgi:hypothetical protein
MRVPLAIPLTGVFLLSPLLAIASSIVVVNPSFEILPDGGLAYPGNPGPYSIGVPIPGWDSTNTANSGQFQPTNVAFNTLDDGPTSAWSRGATLSQQVDALVQVGLIYTLTVDIGWRNDRSFDGTADLLIDGVTYTATGATPVQGGWSTFTATYTGLASDVGSPITIQLNASGPQGNFDDVRLTASPEPVFSGLIGVCLIGLGYRCRKRKP